MSVGGGNPHELPPGFGGFHERSSTTAASSAASAASAGGTTTRPLAGYACTPSPSSGLAAAAATFTDAASSLLCGQDMDTVLADIIRENAADWIINLPADLVLRTPFGATASSFLISIALVLIFSFARYLRKRNYTAFKFLCCGCMCLVQCAYLLLLPCTSPPPSQRADPEQCPHPDPELEQMAQVEELEHACKRLETSLSEKTLRRPVFRKIEQEWGRAIPSAPAALFETDNERPESLITPLPNSGLYPHLSRRWPEAAEDGNASEAFESESDKGSSAEEDDDDDEVESSDGEDAADAQTVRHVKEEPGQVSLVVLEEEVERAPDGDQEVEGVDSTVTVGEPQGFLRSVFSALATPFSGRSTLARAQRLSFQNSERFQNVEDIQIKESPQSATTSPSGSAPALSPPSSASTAVPAAFLAGTPPSHLQRRHSRALYASASTGSIPRRGQDITAGHVGATPAAGPAGALVVAGVHVAAGVGATVGANGVAGSAGAVLAVGQQAILQKRAALSFQKRQRSLESRLDSASRPSRQASKDAATQGHYRSVLGMKPHPRQNKKK